MADVLQVLRLSACRSSITCTSTTNRAAKVGRIGQAGGLLLPAAAQQPPGHVPGDLLRLRPGRDQGAGAGRLLRPTRRATTASPSCRAPTASSWGPGWYTPPGVVHAPGSVLTYEPQWNSDVNSVYENIAAGRGLPVRVPRGKRPGEPQARRRLRDEPDGLGEERRSALQEALLPAAAPLRGIRRRFLREVDRLRQPLRRGKGADRAAGADRDRAGCGGLRLHPRSGSREVRGVRRGERRACCASASSAATSTSSASRRRAKACTITNSSRWEPLVMLKHFGPNNAETPKNVPEA